MSDVGMTYKKTLDFSEWYTQAVLKSKLAEYTPIKGCVVLREHSYAIWEKIQEIFNKKIWRQRIVFWLDSLNIVLFFNYS